MDGGSFSRSPPRSHSAFKSYGFQDFAIPDIPRFDFNNQDYASKESVAELLASDYSLSDPMEGLAWDKDFDNFFDFSGGRPTASEAALYEPASPSLNEDSASSIAWTSSRKRSSLETPEVPNKRQRLEASKEVRVPQTPTASFSPPGRRRSSNVREVDISSRTAVAAFKEIPPGFQFTGGASRGNTEPLPSRREVPDIAPVKDGYTYEILNKFKNPSTALRAIDNKLNSFRFLTDELLQAALQNEISEEKTGVDQFVGACEAERQPYHDRQQQTLQPNLVAGLQQRYPRGYIHEPRHDLVPRFGQQVSPDQGSYREVSRAVSLEPVTGAGLNRKRRTENIKNFDPTKFYRPLPSTPASWGSMDSTTHNHLFRYNPHGELLPTLRYTTRQICEYLENHPLHQIKGKKDSHLRLWIQIAPADSGRRYGSKESSQCRFADCPIKHNTISKGEYRITFDENTHSGFPVDPYHCAGYVHLFCIEKYLNFPQICKVYNVIPDQRIFREGKNKMAITRDYPEMSHIVKKFIDVSAPWSQSCINNGRPGNWYEETLSFSLIEWYLKHQSAQVETLRGRRSGNSINVHRGNLDIYAANEKVIRERKEESKKKGERLIKADVMREVILEKFEFKEGADDEHNQAKRGGGRRGASEDLEARRFIHGRRLGL